MIFIKSFFELNENEIFNLFELIKIFTRSYFLLLIYFCLIISINLATFIMYKLLIYIIWQYYN